MLGTVSEAYDSDDISTLKEACTTWSTCKMDKQGTDENAVSLK